MRTRNNLKWKFPLLRTHCGIALGNGLCGALVWGKERIHVTLNRSDLWDHRGAFQVTETMSYQRVKEVYDPQDNSKMAAVFGRPPWPANTYVPSRLPLGRFELELAEGLQPVSARLEWEKGLLRVDCRNEQKKNTAVTTFAFHPSRPLLLVLDPQQAIKTIHVRPAWEWVKDWQSKYDFKPPRIIHGAGQYGWYQELPADLAVAVVYQKIPAGGLICLARGASGAAAVETASAEIEHGQQQGAETFIKETGRWWQSYWKDVPKLKLPDEFFNHFFVYALYKFGAATNPHGKIPAALQGPWVEEYQPTPWQGDYHFNVNVQQVYSLALPANKLEHLLPLCDMLESWQPVLRHNAKCIAGVEDGLLIGMCVDDRGKCIYGGAGVLLDQACSVWTAQLFWHYYLYSGDIEFLRKCAYPFMAGVMRVYEAMLEEREGKLSLPLAISAEYGNLLAREGKGSMGQDPSWQLAACHFLADALLEATHILNVEPRPIWSSIKGKLPLYTLIGKPGEERIAIWKGLDLEVCHRHHSHLAGIYPFDSLSELTPEKERIIENSIDHWISKGMGEWSEWCFPWAAIIQARLGFKEAPLILMKIWREVFVNEGWATVYLPKFPGLTAHRRDDQKKPRETNEIMQLDGTFAAATALLEMLVHSRGGTVYVFPAVPEHWPDVEFANIGLPGAFRISARRVKGKTESVEIKSLKGGAVHVAAGDRKTMLVQQAGRTRQDKCPIQIDMSAGETVRFSTNEGYI